MYNVTFSPVDPPLHFVFANCTKKSSFRKGWEDDWKFEVTVRSIEGSYRILGDVRKLKSAFIKSITPLVRAFCSYVFRVKLLHKKNSCSCGLWEETCHRTSIIPRENREMEIALLNSISDNIFLLYIAIGCCSEGFEKEFRENNNEQSFGYQLVILLIWLFIIKMD